MGGVIIQCADYEVRTGYAELPKVVEGFYETALRNSGSE